MRHHEQCSHTIVVQVVVALCLEQLCHTIQYNVQWIKLVSYTQISLYCIYQSCLPHNGIPLVKILLLILVTYLWLTTVWLSRNLIIYAVHSLWYQILSNLCCRSIPCHELSCEYIWKFWDTTRWFCVNQELVRFIIRVFIMDLLCHGWSYDCLLVRSSLRLAPISVSLITPLKLYYRECLIILIYW